MAETEDTSMDLMYPIALDTFEWAQKRKESIDTRIQTQLSFLAGFIFVISLLVRKSVPDTTFHSPWFVGAILFFIGAVVFGTVARFSGYLKLFNIAAMFEDAQTMLGSDFKREIIERAGIGLTLNRKALRRKRRWNISMLASFGVAYACLFIWLLRAV